jgi:hypothetical protein
VPSTKERGVLLLLDEAFIERLDRETAIVEALQVVPEGRKRLRVPRSVVMRAMLRAELDRRATARGESVPTAEPVSFVSFTTTETVNVERESCSKLGSEAGSLADGDESSDQGDVEDRGEGNGVDGAAALTAEMGPPPERVTPGRIVGSVKRVGVRLKA